MSLLAAINGRVPVSGDRRSAKPPGDVLWHAVGSTPNPSAKLFERSLPRFEFVLALFVPVRAFAKWANSRFPCGALARHPFVLAPVTFIAFLFDGDQCHKTEDILDNNILSRYTLVLTNIYLSSNIFLR